MGFVTGATAMSRGYTTVRIFDVFEQAALKISLTTDSWCTMCVTMISCKLDQIRACQPLHENLEPHCETPSF